MFTTAILLLIVLTSLFITVRKVGWRKWFDSLKEFDEESPLYIHSVFHLAISIPLIVALGFAMTIAPGLNAEFSVEGYKQFLDYFNFPLWIAGGSILFGIAVGRFHASKQRARTIRNTLTAIEQTETNNSFRNYFEHKKMFIESFHSTQIDIRGLNGRLLCEAKVDKYYLYESLFKENSISNFNIDCFEGGLGHIAKVHSLVDEVSVLVGDNLLFDVDSKGQKDQSNFYSKTDCFEMTFVKFDLEYGISIEFIPETKNEMLQVINSKQSLDDEINVLFLAVIDWALTESSDLIHAPRWHSHFTVPNRYRVNPSV